MAIGVRIGASTRIAAEVSMNIPTMSKSTFTANKNAMRVSNISLNHAAISLGRPDRVIRNENSAAAEMIIIIAEVDMIVFFKISGRSRNFNSP